MKFRDGSASPVSTFESSILSKVSLRSPHDGSRLLAVPEGYRNSGLTGPRMFETLRTYLVHTHTHNPRYLHAILYLNHPVA